MTRPDYTPAQRAYKPPQARGQAWDVARFYRVYLTRGGPPCGLKILYGPPSDPVTGEPLDRSHRWQVWLNGALLDEPAQFLLHFEPDGTPVIKGDYIDAAEYEYLLQLSNYARTHDATLPEAEPHKPVNRRTMAPILPPR